MTDKDHINVRKNSVAPRRVDWPLITEFANRRDYFRRWILAAVMGTAILATAGLYLSAIAIFLLFPLYGALAYLRCPGCDTSTTLLGITDGRHCLRCGQRLRY